MFKHSFELYSRWEADSWIIVTKVARIMNLCTSAQESWITRLWENLNKIDVSINCVRSREWKIWRFRPSAMIFRFFSWGAYPGMHSGLTVRLFLQWHSVLNVQLQKTPHVHKTNDDTKKQWSKIYIILLWAWWVYPKIQVPFEYAVVVGQIFSSWTDNKTRNCSCISSHTQLVL